MEVFDWKFLPSQLLAEDELLMEDIFRISEMSSWVEEAGEVECVSTWTEDTQKMGEIDLSKI